ncbi:MAG: germination protein YpeB [Lachnospiraceae bacterium]
MEKTMSKRRKVRLLAYTLAAFTVLLTFSVVGNVRAARMTRQIRIARERALCELDTYISNINTNLQKGAYANTPTMLGTMASQLRREATGAKSSLAVLPLSETRLDNTYKFLSQIGDFVTALSKKVEQGETISDEEREQLFALLRFSETLTKDISDMRQQLFDGYLDFESAESTLEQKDEQIASLSQNMEDAEQSLTEYPSLLYDGPFSDHINQRDAALLQDKAEITKEEALKKAAEILGLVESDVTFLSEENDTTAAYCFSGGDRTVAVTKKGGYLLYLLSGQFVGESKLEYADARKYASEFLNNNAFFDMQESYYTVSDGICTINYAYRDGEYICYPDLIKISVSLEDGKILSADCRGYVMNHKARSPVTPALTAAEAQKKVSPLLTVTDTRLAVIPTESMGERTAYEFHCKNKDGAEFLVYINTVTGYEDDILLLLYSDDGVLTK